jgi:hypothetical protein
MLLHALVTYLDRKIHEERRKYLLAATEPPTQAA